MFQGERLEKLLLNEELSQSELARRIGVSATTIWKLVNDPAAQGSKHLHKIARALKTSPEYLLGETNDPTPSSRDMSDNDDDTVEVNALDIAYGMGGTYIDDNTVTIDKVKFSRSWLRNFTDAPPDMLFVAQGIGDSMWPTIHDTDVVLVDRTERVVRMVDKIWAMSFGEVGMIKRLRPKPDGTFTILSDNPNVPDDRATDGELFIVGRVAAIVRKV